MKRSSHPKRDRPRSDANIDAAVQYMTSTGWPGPMRDDPLLKHIPKRLKSVLAGYRLGVRPTDFLWKLKPGDWFVYIEQGKIYEAVEWLREQNYRFKFENLSAFNAETESYVGQIFVIRRHRRTVAVALKLAFG